MAYWMNPSEEQIEAYETWLSTRQDAVRQVGETISPWKLYRLDGGKGHRVTLYSFSEMEDGSVSLVVNVTGQYNAVAFDRQVFGIDPDTLVECDLPADGEPLGAVFTEDEDVERLCDSIRAGADA